MADPCKVYVLAYKGGSDDVHHWQIGIRLGTAEDGKATGNRYHIIGNKNEWHFAPPGLDVKFRNAAWKACLIVGRLQRNMLSRFEDIAKGVQLHPGREDWNSQNWVFAVLKQLEMQGFNMDKNCLSSLEVLRLHVDDAYQKYWETGDESASE